MITSQPSNVCQGKKPVGSAEIKQTDKQADGHTDGQTDRHTDGRFFGTACFPPSWNRNQAEECECLASPRPWPWGRPHRGRVPVPVPLPVPPPVGSRGESWGTGKNPKLRVLLENISFELYGLHSTILGNLHVIYFKFTCRLKEIYY